MGPCLSCTEDSPSGRSTPGEVSQHRAEGQVPLLCPAGHTAVDAAQDMAGFGLWGHSAGSHPVAIHQHPQVLFSRAVLPPCTPQLVLLVGVTMTHPGARTCIWICWTSWGSPGLNVKWHLTMQEKRNLYTELSCSDCTQSTPCFFKLPTRPRTVLLSTKANVQFVFLLRNIFSLCIQEQTSLYFLQLGLDFFYIKISCAAEWARIKRSGCP